MNTLKLTGRIDMVLKDMYGKVKDHRFIKNTVTTVGKAEAAMLLGALGTAFDYIAIGTSTPGATALGAEASASGSARRGGADVTFSTTTTDTTGDTAQWVTTFTFTGSLGITEEGIFNDASAGTMLASQSFDVLNVANGDTLEITHQLKCA